MATNNQFDSLFDEAGQTWNVDPALLKTVFHLESGGNPNTPNSSAGAKGGMQFMSDTAKAMDVTDPTDMRQAAFGAAHYLRDGLDTTGTPEGALAYYFAGPDRSGWGPKTAAYVAKGQSFYPAMAVNASAAPDNQIQQLRDQVEKDFPSAPATDTSRQPAPIPKGYVPPPNEPAATESMQPETQQLRDQIEKDFPSSTATASSASAKPSVPLGPVRVDENMKIIPEQKSLPSPDVENLPRATLPAEYNNPLLVDENGIPIGPGTVPNTDRLGNVLGTAVKSIINKANTAGAPVELQGPKLLNTPLGAFLKPTTDIIGGGLGLLNGTYSGVQEGVAQGGNAISPKLGNDLAGMMDALPMFPEGHMLIGKADPKFVYDEIAVNKSPTIAMRGPIPYDKMADGEKISRLDAVVNSPPPVKVLDGVDKADYLSNADKVPISAVETNQTSSNAVRHKTLMEANNPEAIVNQADRNNSRLDFAKQYDVSDTKLAELQRQREIDDAKVQKGEIKQSTWAKRDENWQRQINEVQALRAAGFQNLQKGTMTLADVDSVINNIRADLANDTPAHDAAGNTLPIKLSRDIGQGPLNVLTRLHFDLARKEAILDPKTNMPLPGVARPADLNQMSKNMASPGVARRIAAFAATEAVPLAINHLIGAYIPPVVADALDLAAAPASQYLINKLAVGPSKRRMENKLMGIKNDLGLQK